LSPRENHAARANQADFSIGRALLAISVII
jgi:hypothetical protein